MSHHIPSARFLWGIAGALAVLTFITVALTWVNIPAPWNIIVALVIAVIKASLVALFFMNLYWDARFNMLVIILGVSFLGVLILLTLMDTLSRGEIVPSF